MLRDKIIGMEISRYSHVATLSPVQTAPAAQTSSIPEDSAVKDTTI